ncbi:DivIVA domain-containing protein [candidate division TA06 bacterium]|uniref:DivIVA domain-containing protein n=1 Tax=candidate division TA06 bacterium TaxID=2250710 RepID=A0A933I950_UNCT6|nr:DivIVA domain-containing protein [candidate division TA06 bacterium]
MKLTPLDIRKQTFKKKPMGGLDPAEVLAFLEMVAGEVEELIRENTSLAERLEGLETKVDDYRRMEKTLQDTLLSAQKTSEDLRKNAEQRGDLMIKEAQFKADQIIGEARARLMDLQRQIADLKNMRSGYLAKFRSLLDSHLEMLQYQEMDSGVRIQTNIFAGSKKEEASPAAKSPESSGPPARTMNEQKLADMQRMLSTLMETAKMTTPEPRKAEEANFTQTENPNNEEPK